MQFDLYRRDEGGGKQSFLAVPAGRPLPGEVQNTDWERQDSPVEIDEDAEHLPQWGIARIGAQVREKGYAITSLEQQDEATG